MRKVQLAGFGARGRHATPRPGRSIVDYDFRRAARTPRVLPVAHAALPRGGRPRRVLRPALALGPAPLGAEHIPLAAGAGALHVELVALAEPRVVVRGEVRVARALHLPGGPGERESMKRK
jgi:hypothetical protein